MRLILHWNRQAADVEHDRNRCLYILEDVIWQACYIAESDHLDSMALSAYADAMRLLAEYGILTIQTDYGRRVIAKPFGHRKVSNGRKSRPTTI